MHKFTKIAVSFLLILSIIINPFASVLDIRARASGTAVAFGKFVVDFIIEQIIFQAGNQMWQYSIENPEAVGSAYKFTAFNNFENFITAGDVIQVEYDIYKDGEGVIGGTYKPTGFYLDPLNTSNATEEQIETYQLIVDTCNEYIAEGGDIEFITNNIGGAYFFNPSGYEELKTKLTNKFIQKSLVEANVDMIANGVVPSYDFNFVGPSPSLQFPGGTTISTSTMAGGFVYTSPLPSTGIYTSRSRAYPLTAELAESIGADSYVQRYDYCDVSWYRTCYGASHYCLFNGKLYFNQAFWYSDSDPTAHSLRLENPHYSPQYYYCADGTTLVDDGFNSDSEYSIGLAFNMTNEHKSSIPIKATLTEDEFVTTTEDKSVEIPRTEEEDIIGQALGLGLINPDSALEFSEDGTIAGADGLTLAKLQELIDMIAEGKLDFESIQEYLDLITKLVASGNYTAAEQAALLENLKELEKAQVDELTAIKDAITSIAATSEVAVDTDFDIDTPDSIIDKFPFCLPFDVYTVFNLLSAEPEAPSFDIPFKMEGVFDFSMEIDLSEFDAIANIVRWFIYIIFILGLIFVTNSLIGRG